MRERGSVYNNIAGFVRPLIMAGSEEASSISNVKILEKLQYIFKA